MTDPRQPLTDDEIDDLLTSTLHGPLPNLTMSRVLATVAEVPGLRADIEEASRRVELLGSMLSGDPGAKPPEKDGDPMPQPLAVVCRILSDALEACPEAENYLGFGWRNKDNGKAYNIVLQHAEGEAPQVKAARLQVERDALRGMLGDVQWSAETPGYGEPCCPECRALSTGEHAPDCPLATLLNGPS